MSSHFFPLIHHRLTSHLSCRNVGVNLNAMYAAAKANQSAQPKATEPEATAVTASASKGDNKQTPALKTKPRRPTSYAKSTPVSCAESTLW